MEFVGILVGEKFQAGVIALAAVGQSFLSAVKQLRGPSARESDCPNFRKRDRL
jgi:hypothetical protein